MTTFDLENPEPKEGDELRDEAANLLTLRYGRPYREPRVGGKKVDLYFKKDDFGREVRVFVEAKDYSRNLTRNDLVKIVTDYDGIIDQRMPDTVLVISRQGLSTDAQEMVRNEKSFLRHQTIWELEDNVLGLTAYFRRLATIFDDEGLSHYYVAARGNSAAYDEKGEQRIIATENIRLIEQLEAWLQSAESTPVAILGGYGAGKTSLAKRIISAQAAEALRNPAVRRPILVPLGNFMRACTLANLLAGMFANEYGIDGFSLPRLLALNEKGRLLIVLDGFDEMKHAMTAIEFKTQIEELRPLLAPEKAKVILLGRPSAFLSHDEHYEILQGSRRLGAGWRRLPDWPQFDEYDLLGFTPEERKDFVRRYLEYNGRRHSTSLHENWITKRAEEVNALADQDPGIFEKPVHAKILTDLATDPNVDLSSLKERLTRWHLYKAFFESLAERENRKDARRAIGDGRRIEFLRDLAFWLWTQKGGATAFSIHELPDTLFERAYANDDDIDVKAARREFLAGAFLEKKSATTYYFPHRSFAEFLIAEYMTLHPPSDHGHQLYSRISTDGVIAFLQDAPLEAGVGTWTQSLAGAAGLVSVEYLAFLFEMERKSVGAGELPKDCTLHALLPVLPELTGAEEPTVEVILSLLRHPRNAVFLNAVWVFRRHVGALQRTALAEKRKLAAIDFAASHPDAEIVAALLDRIFKDAVIDAETGKAPIPRSSEEALRLAQSLRIELADDYERTLLFSASHLNAAIESLAKEDIVLLSEDAATPVARKSEVEISWARVLERMGNSAGKKAVAYFGRHDDLHGIFVREVTPKPRMPSGPVKKKSAKKSVSGRRRR